MASQMGTFVRKYELRWEKPPGTTMRNFVKDRDEILEETGVNWHKKSLPKHFTDQGAREYGYAKRSERYQRYKARKFNHSLPLVYTGRLRSAAAAMAVVKASNKRMTVDLPAVPKYLYQNVGPVKKDLELTFVSENELGEIAKYIETRLVEQWENRHESPEIVKG